MPATAINTTQALPVATHTRVVPWRRLLPLWRHAVWLLALFAVLAMATAVRLDVQRLRMDLDRSDRLHRGALVLNERLHLEIDARKRLAVMLGAAEDLAMRGDVDLVEVTK
jgi:hypothetical protein